MEIRSSNSFYNCFQQDKKALVLVPHEDDEINVAGNLISIMGKSGIDIHIAFSTNGDFKTDAELRYNEALNSISVLGASKENIYFLGYPDTQPGDICCVMGTDKHPYLSHAGSIQTYGIFQYPEYCFLKEGKHKEYKKENFIEDIKNLINEIKPDIIICVDYDKHPDHMMLSYAFELAIDEILKINSTSNYYPQILKRFAYSLAYFATDDYYAVNLEDTKIPTDENVPRSFNLINKSIYQWQNRIRIPTSIENRVGKSIKNQQIFQCLWHHRSQFAAFRATRIINADEVFWERRCDNLLMQATITATSGNIKNINHFPLFTAQNFTSDYLDFVNDAWIPEKSDTDKTLSVLFFDVQDISRIILIGRMDVEDIIEKVKISFDSGDTICVNDIPGYGVPLDIAISVPLHVKKVAIKIEENKGNNHITRIGMFNDKNYRSVLPSFIKITINGKFIYQYFMERNSNKCDIGIYRYHFNDVVNIKVLNGDAEIQGNKLIIKSRKKSILVRAENSDGSIFDQIIICFKKPNFITFIKYMDCIWMRIFRVKTHLYLLKESFKRGGIHAVIRYIYDRI